MAVQKLEQVYMRKGRGQGRRMTQERGRGDKGRVQEEGPASLENVGEGSEGACRSRKFLGEQRRPGCLRVTHLIGDLGG